MSDSRLVLNRVRHTVAEIFNLPVEEITPESSSQTIEKWDSMGHLMLILQLEQEFETQFDPEQVEQMHSVQAIVNELPAGSQ